MDINFWMQGERWSNYVLPILILGGLILFLFFGLIPFLYVRNKATKILFSTTTVILLLSVLAIFVQNNRFKEYLAESRYVSATTRSYTVSWLHKVPYSYSEIQAMKYISAYEFPSKLSMYKRTAVKQKISYLGREDYYFYFEYAGRTMRFDDSDVSRTNGNSAYFTGYKFTLKDQNYKKIGFFSLPNYFRKGVYVPKSIINRPASEQIKKEYGRPGLAGKWIVDSAK